jgi:Protein of unknown function (DUF1566)
VPTKVLLPLHYALTDNDLTFNTFRGAESSFTTAGTAGCSCTQIIALSGLGPLAGKLGCNQQVMKTFIAGLQAAPSDPGQQFPATGQTGCWDSSGTSIPCTNTGQDGDIQAGATLSYTDNGDGTITDDNTSLMWEKLCDEDPPGTTCPEEHDVDTEYTWANAFGKITTLNTTPCFAGHCDWRLPNIKELQSIVNYQIGGPAVSSAFNNNCAAPCSVTTCSCTAASFSWSSTSYASVPSFAWAWGVVFGDGRVDAFAKIGAFRVRAVRGGQ